MRPYRLRMRLSSKRLNVTRLCAAAAELLRSAAPLSLGSASPDIKSMLRLLSFQARSSPKPGFHARDRATTVMIAPTARGCKRAAGGNGWIHEQNHRHGIVSG